MLQPKLRFQFFPVDDSLLARHKPVPGMKLMASSLLF
jgi:hypothetical protein